ncbi:NUDIX domain-containing protein [Lysinibacillus sphaericus]|uniref:NUDIX domain-containing protein n=1 Tax=Lysinibacillus sphaericus TaxID=1421 RepID=A0A544V099_LYSSH|nr:NUDIX hydrolase [Lysinibacillus sp. SDF0037]TQR39531.1 NUDIX domain-containing protein [Lysinibacillus sp. SDF0037]
MDGYTMELRKLIGNRPLILVGSTIIVINDKKEILFQYRSDTKEWGLPGGAMEIGENLEQTAERELFEETGLKAKSFKFIDTLSGSNLYYKYPNGDEVYNVICVYLAEDTSGELAMNDGESLDLKYFPINELPCKLDEGAKIIIEKHFI